MLLPSDQLRVRILQQLSSPMPLAYGVDLEAVALTMPPMASGADLNNLCKEVAINASTKGGQGFFSCWVTLTMNGPENVIFILLGGLCINEVKVTWSDFDRAMSDMEISITQDLFNRHLKFAQAKIYKNGKK